MVKNMKSQVTDKAVEMSKLFNKIINSKKSMSAKFSSIISMVAKQLNVDAAVCYLVIDDNYIELFASHNINPKLINHISIKVGEGIIGGIAQSKLTTEVENIWQHPNFLYREGVDEEKYKSFSRH